MTIEEKQAYTDRADELRRIRIESDGLRETCRDVLDALEITRRSEDWRRTPETVRGAIEGSINALADAVR